MRRLVATAAILVLLGSGCATRESVRDLRGEIEALRAEILPLRQSHDEHARETARAADRLAALERRVADIGAGLGDTARTVADMRRALADLHEALEQVRADLAARGPRVAPAPASEPAAAARHTPAADDHDAEVRYRQALATFRAREHGQAVLQFLDFLGRYPGHRLAPSAQYWIGEAYYVQRDYRQGLAEFQRVLQMPSRSGKAADALLKIGLCHANLGEPSLAEASWRRLIVEYPQSEAAVRARALLER